jgi:hypothetical protein
MVVGEEDMMANKSFKLRQRSSMFTQALESCVV